MINEIEVFTKVRHSGLSDCDAFYLIMQATELARAQRRLEMKVNRFEERLTDALEDSYSVKIRRA